MNDNKSKDENYYFVIEVRSDFDIGCSIDEEETIKQRLASGVKRVLNEIANDGGVAHTNVPPVKFQIRRIETKIK